MSSIKNVLGLPDPLLANPSTSEGSTRRAQTTPQPAPPGPSTPINTTKSATENQLTAAIRAARPLNQSSLFAPASSTMVHEAPQSYCDSTAEQDLKSFDA